jgi:SHS2 domain-containing protein
MSTTYRILPHPADVGMAVEASTLVQLLDGCVRALADIETGGALPAPDSTRALTEAHPDATAEERVVDVLEQCLVWLDTEDWLATGVDSTGENLVGCPLSEEARESGTHVKAVTWHQLEVKQGEGGWSATVFVDL